MTLGSAGLFMLVIGTVLACKAERYSGRVAQVEYAAGLLIVGGLSIIGLGLGWAVDPLPFAAP